jgi:CubicO group peptidase (beta-lactamase class C family)
MTARTIPVGLALLAIALAAASVAVAATPPDTASFGRALDACVAQAVAEGELSGQFLVARHGRILVERAWGAADRGGHVPMTPTTRLCIASITKSVTQIVARELVREGRVSLSDSLGRFLPGYAHGRVTVGQLLAHTSGIPHRVTSDAEEEQPLGAADVTERAGRTPLLFEPGSRTLYSSAGYTVLARVLGIAAGRTWADLVRERVLAPAGLEHTVPSAGLAQDLPGRAESYLPGASGVEQAPRKDLGFLEGAGSMWSTARDLQRLAGAVLDGTFGADVRADLLRRGRLEWSGSTNGFFSYLDHDSAGGTTVVFVGNLQTGAPAILRFAVRGLLAGREVKPIEVPHPEIVIVPLALLRPCEGRYDVPGNPGLPVEIRHGMLWADDRPLRATSDTTFYCPTDYSRISVARDPTGAVRGLNWMIGPRSLFCPRVGGLDPPPAGR